jgi:hypothetical protein
MKKVTGKQAGEHYEYVCEKTGEITNRTPEFNHMSLKPGIGAKWLEKYHTDVYPNDYVVIRGKKVKPPKYYDKKWAKEYPIEFDMIQFERESKAKENYLENFDDRLKVREQVAAARLSFLKRQLT